MSITLDDDFDYTIDERRGAEDDGPALRLGYVPPPSLGEGAGAFGTGTVDKDSEPFLTLRDPSRSTIDWNRFVRPATPEEIKAYDEWEERRAKQGMGAVISQVFQDRRQAWEQTPDQAAHRMWLERQTGIPQRMLQDGDVLRTAEMRAQMGMDALTLHDAPEQVVSWLKTPGMLEIARDDLETLKKAGDALQRLAASKAPTRPGGKWKDLRSGIADVLEGKADVREMQAAARMSPSVLEPEADVGMSSGVMGLGRGFLASLPKEVRKDVTASMSRAALSNADEWRSWAEWVRPEPYVLPKEGTFSRWLSDVVRGTPYTLTGMPVSAALTTGGAVLGGPLGATAGAALSSLIQTNGEAQTEQAQVWKQLVDQGMDPAEAYDKSFNEVYLPNFGLLYLSNFLQDRLTFGVPMGRGAAYWAKRGGNLLLSSLFEGGEEIGQSLISNRALGEENDWGQLLYEGAVGVGVGLVFSGGGTALDAVMGRYREHRAEADAARESTRIGVVMDEAVKAAEASKVRERSPEAFDDFVEYVGGQGQEKVNVDGAVFFQTFGEDAYAAAERLGIAEGLDEAARTGGAVEIPTAAILKNPDLYEKVKNDLRYSDDGMSRNEAQEYERTRGERNRADIDAAASAVRTVQESGEKAERIRDGLRSQFEALGHKKVGKREAEFYSTIWTAAIANEARYAGVDIEEMAHRPEWNLRFQYDRGAGDISRMRDVYTHPVNAGVDLGQKVPILDLSGMEGTSTPKELLARLKDMALKDEAWISRDAEVFATLPRGKKLKHVAYSSRKGDLRQRSSIGGSLDGLVQNAVLIESTPNNDPAKTNVLNFHRLYVPVRTDAGIQTVRIVAEELKGSDSLKPTDVELYDVVLEGQKESPAVNHGLLAKEVVPSPGAPFELTIADMLRGVKDAEGNPYVGEEYRQSSVRQSEDYDYSDPKTWPEGPGRDEALMLEAWQNFEPDGEIETWPESPEKTEALALREEYGEIETWVENLSREEFDRMLWSDDPEFVRKNERGEEIENRLRVLARRLRKKKPKGAEGRLLQLIEAEEEAAAREAETYYQSAYHGSPRQSEDYDPSDPKTWPAGAARDEALNLLSEIEVLRMGAMHPNTWQDTRRAREAREIRRRKNRLMSVERDPRTWMEGPRKDDALTYRETLDEDGEVELDPNTWMEESPFKQEALEAWGQYTELGEVLTQKQGLGEPLPQKSIDAYNKVDELLWMLRAQEQERVGERLEDLREEEFNAVDEEMDRLDNRYSDLEDKESRAMLASAEPLQDRLETLISAEEESAAREAETYYQQRGPLTFKLTGKPVSEAYMAALEKLEAGEPVAAEEYNAIPEIQDARSRTATGSTLNATDREGIRKQVYDKLMSYGSAVTEVVDGRERTVYNGEVRNDHRADIIIGLPASGKSSALVDPISSRYKSMFVDSDEAKKLIPEFDDGFGAGYVHEESKRIVTTVLSDVTDEGKNIVVPIVGSDYIKLKRLYIDGLRQKGYKVYVHMADINPNVAAGRNLRRFAETGRFVDLAATSFKYGNKPREVFERVKKEGIADGYSRIDTTVFPGRQVEGTEDISHDRGDLRERRGRSLSDVHAPGEGESSQTGAAGGGGAAAGLGAERAGGTSREGTAPRGVSGRASGTPLGSTQFTDAETIVTILRDGNRSTFLHELGHVFLNSRKKLALMEGVDDTVRQDWATLVEWLEVADIDFSKPLSEVDEKRWRNAHEKFAAGFEKYLMEGRAPNLDLARAFRAFRKWLTDIYKAVRNVFYVDADGNRVEFEINDEIRGVMDRMLASEEEIEESRAVQEAERLAHILTEQGIPDDVAERYRDAVAAGADAARAKLYKKLTAELKAEKQAELKEARKAAHKQAGAEVWDLPEYRALKALLTPRDKGGLRLSMPELIALYGDAGAEALARELPVGVLANDGLPLAEAVELLGYGTPEALLEDLKRAKKLPPQQAVADRVRTATAQLESLIHDPEALRAEAERIMHGRERLEWLALETEMLDEAAHRLGKKIGEDARREERERRKQRERDQNRRAEEDLRGVFGPENLAAMAQAAEAEAKRILAGKRMRDISVSHYMAAEKRASAKALQAAASARFEEARQWKRTELINHALALEAMNVREEYEKGRKLLERYWPNRRRLRGVMGNEAFNQIIGLLERLGVNPEDPAAKDRPRLDEYLNDLAKKRETMPPVARWLRDLDIRDARASLANLTPEQFEDVTKAVTALDRIGRLENKLLTAQRNETFAETVERLRAATEKQHGLPGAQSRATDQKGVGLFAGALASLDRVETLLRKADGLEEQGAFWEAIYLPAQRAYEAELVKGKAAKEAIEALLDKHFEDKRAFNRFLNEKLDTGMIDPGTEKKLYWTGENLLCAMLNWGNQHNRERLVYGNGLRENALNTREAARPADDAQYYAEYEAGKAVAEAIFERLATDEMWDFCQDVWDYLDTFWPEIEALEERLNGAAPEKVEATPIRTASGRVLRGGYYPVRFDANADWTAFVHNEQESVKALYEDQTHRPGTRKGHTKERVERVAPRQLLLSLDVIAEHTANVVHDLTHREAVRDLYKLIHDDAVRGLLTHAVGRAGFEQFSPWIQSLAAPSTPTDKADRVFSKAMGNAAAVQLGLNMVSSVGQTVSLVPAAWKLGLRRVVPAVLNTLTLRGFWDSKYRDFAFALSPELADRINGTDRNIRAALDLERSGARKRALSGAKAALYVALGWADMAVSLPVWHAAYEKGMARWNDQRKAVDYANYVVRTTNNAGAAKDLAQVQRGGPTRRLFTMYYSAFGSLYQMFHEQMTRAGREGVPGKIKLAAFCFMMFTVQSALEDLVKGRAPLGGDDDDDKSVGKWLMQGTLLSASSMFPIVRDIASGTTLLGGTGKFRPSPALEAGSAFIKAVDSGAKVVADAWNGEDVEAERVVKNMVEAGGYAFGLPSVQLLRWYKTFVRWANGEPDWSPWELIWHKRGR